MTERVFRRVAEAVTLSRDASRAFQHGRRRLRWRGSCFKEEVPARPIAAQKEAP